MCANRTSPLVVVTWSESRMFKLQFGRFLYVHILGKLWLTQSIPFSSTRGKYPRYEIEKSRYLLDDKDSFVWREERTAISLLMTKKTERGNRARSVKALPQFMQSTTKYLSTFPCT